jgi:hypothetical protein
MYTVLNALAWVAPAFAEDPEFLLSDLNVRLDLDKSRWRMTRWSTFDFEAKVDNDPVLLSAWSTPVQTPVKPAEGWSALYEQRVIAAMKGDDPKTTRTAVEGVKDGAKWAFVDVTFQLPTVGAIALRGATAEIEGQNFHFAVVAPQKMANVADRERDKIVRKLEFTKPVPTLEYGGRVENEHLATKLPSGWRSLHEGELEGVGERILKFGVDDVTGCWVAIRPRPSAEPDVMVTCPRSEHLGVVDEYSFADLDEGVRKKFFGGEIPAGRTLALVDRTGFLYAPRDGLAFAVIPDSDKVSVTWALGEGPLDDQVQAALAPATFSAPHLVTTNDQVNYYLKYQWSSPLVICPATCLLGGVLLVGGLVVGAARRGRRGTAEDEE